MSKTSIYENLDGKFLPSEVFRDLTQSAKDELNYLFSNEKRKWSNDAALEKLSSIINVNGLWKQSAKGSKGPRKFLLATNAEAVKLINEWVKDRETAARRKGKEIEALTATKEGKIQLTTDAKEAAEVIQKTAFPELRAADAAQLKLQIASHLRTLKSPQEVEAYLERLMGSKFEDIALPYEFKTAYEDVKFKLEKLLSDISAIPVSNLDYALLNPSSVSAELAKKYFDEIQEKYDTYKNYFDAIKVEGATKGTKIYISKIKDLLDEIKTKLDVFDVDAFKPAEEIEKSDAERRELFEKERKLRVERINKAREEKEELEKYNEAMLRASEDRKKAKLLADQLNKAATLKEVIAEKLGDKDNVFPFREIYEKAAKMADNLRETKDLVGKAESQEEVNKLTDLLNDKTKQMESALNDEVESLLNKIITYSETAKLRQVFDIIFYLTGLSQKFYYDFKDVFEIKFHEDEVAKAAFSNVLANNKPTHEEFDEVEEGGESAIKDEYPEFPGNYSLVKTYMEDVLKTNELNRDTFAGRLSKDGKNAGVNYVIEELNKKYFDDKNLEIFLNKIKDDSYSGSHDGQEGLRYRALLGEIVDKIPAKAKKVVERYIQEYDDAAAKKASTPIPTPAPAPTATTPAPTPASTASTASTASSDDELIKQFDEALKRNGYQPNVVEGVLNSFKRAYKEAGKNKVVNYFNNSVDKNAKIPKEIADELKQKLTEWTLIDRKVREKGQDGVKSTYEIMKKYVKNQPAPTPTPAPTPAPAPAPTPVADPSKASTPAADPATTTPAPAPAPTPTPVADTSKASTPAADPATTTPVVDPTKASTPAADPATTTPAADTSKASGVMGQAKKKRAPKKKVAPPTAPKAKLLFK